MDAVETLKHLYESLRGQSNLYDRLADREGGEALRSYCLGKAAAYDDAATKVQRVIAGLEG